MRGRGPMLMLFMAIGLAFATTYLVYRWMSQQAGMPQRATVLTQQVVVAALDLAPGTPLRSEFFKVIRWPQESVPKAAFTEPNVLVDRVTLSPILAGEPILASKLAGQGMEGGLSAIIQPGKRAVSVKVDEIIGVAGFVVPGTHVDVLVTVEEKENRKLDATVLTILQNIKVLTSGQKVMQEKDKPIVVNVVTLEVSPEEAERLALASNRGRIQLSLRNQIDEVEAETAGINTLQLIRGRDEEPTIVRPRVARIVKPVPVQEPETVEIIRGDSRSKQKVGP